MFELLPIGWLVKTLVICSANSSKRYLFAALSIVTTLGPLTKLSPFFTWILHGPVTASARTSTLTLISVALCQTGSLIFIPSQPVTLNKDWAAQRKAPSYRNSFHNILLVRTFLPTSGFWGKEISWPDLSYDKVICQPDKCDVFYDCAFVI
jgi:hypothetical protein